jgi:hypothetical protein
MQVAAAAAAVHCTVLQGTPACPRSYLIYSWR